MKLINYPIFILLLSFTLFSCKTKKRELAKEEEIKPNVIFLLVDDMGWKDLACYGSTFYETPNIDRLAAMGVKFTNAYSPNPVSSPTRAAIMTGKYPSRVGITDWIPGDDPKNRKLRGPEDLHELPLEEVTVAEILKEKGYKTFFAGKWHLGGEGKLPTDQGFDINLGGYHYGQPPGGYYSPYKNKMLKDGPVGEFLTDRLTSESMKFIEENKNNPFYVHLAFYTVHVPIQANKEYIEKFEKKRDQLEVKDPLLLQEGIAYTVQNQTDAAYASMIYALDVNVGRLLDQLDSLNLTDNTLIIFTSDNGGLTTLENTNWEMPTSVVPLRAGKGWAYEGGIRVPFIVKPVGKKAKEQVLETPIISMDIYPTILGYLNVDKRPTQQIDGKNLFNLIENGQALNREALFFHYPHYHSSGWKPGSAIRLGDWKLIHLYEDDRYELYNLKDDIGEKKDLSGQNPSVVESLKIKLQEMIKDTHSKLPTLN
ncbi:MAG: sulfatase [Candidatus Saccharimonadaceae bacterium]